MNYPAQSKGGIKSFIIQLEEITINSRYNRRIKTNHQWYVYQDYGATNTKRAYKRNWQQPHCTIQFDIIRDDKTKDYCYTKSETGNKIETLSPGQISSNEEGTKDYIETNRLIDFPSEFLWKAREKADRRSQVKVLNHTKPPFDYQA